MWKKFLVFGLLGAPLVLSAVLFVVTDRPKVGVGEGCTQNEDCLRGGCLVLSKPVTLGRSVETGRICSIGCSKTSDCPPSMECVGAARFVEGEEIWAGHAAERSMCAPER